MKIRELKEAIEKPNISDDDILFIRTKIETESRAGITNVISELCVEKSGMIYEIVTLLSEVF